MAETLLNVFLIIMGWEAVCLLFRTVVSVASGSKGPDTTAKAARVRRLACSLNKVGWYGHENLASVEGVKDWLRDYADRLDWEAHEQLGGD